jgi:hypothetical protein
MDIDTPQRTDRRQKVTTKTHPSIVTRYFHPARERTKKNLKLLDTELLSPEVKNHLNGHPLYIGERVVTLLWRPRITDTELAIAYGASIFHKESRQEEWNRRSHRATAFGRLTTIPVVITQNDMVEEAFEVSSLNWTDRIRNLDIRGLASTDRETHKKRSEDEETISLFIRKFLLPKYGVDGKKKVRY